MGLNLGKYQLGDHVETMKLWDDRLKFGRVKKLSNRLINGMLSRLRDIAGVVGTESRRSIARECSAKSGQSSPAFQSMPAALMGQCISS
jgi:hypothetical protein